MNYSSQVQPLLATASWATPYSEHGDTLKQQAEYVTGYDATAEKVKKENEYEPQKYDESVRGAHVCIVISAILSTLISLLLLLVMHLNQGALPYSYIMIHMIRKGKNVTGTGDCSANSPCQWSNYRSGPDQLTNVMDDAVSILFLNCTGFVFMCIVIYLESRAHLPDLKLKKDPHALKKDLLRFMLNPNSWWAYFSLRDRIAVRRSLFLTLLEVAQLSQMAAVLFPMYAMNETYMPIFLAALMLAVGWMSWQQRENYDKTREYILLKVKSEREWRNLPQQSQESDIRRWYHENLLHNGWTLKHQQFFDVDNVRDWFMTTGIWVLVTYAVSQQVADSPSVPQQMDICIVFWLIWLAFVLQIPQGFIFMARLSDMWRHDVEHGGEEWSEWFVKSTILRLFFLLLVPLIVGGILAQFFMSSTPGFTYLIL